jgi:hypothetical protein
MANNPHAEIYKGSTTFSGPIKAGSRWLDVPNYDRTTVPGTIAVKDLPNAGFVVCSQSAAVQQIAPPASIIDITLPSGSMILSIQYIVTAPFTGTVKDCGLFVTRLGVSNSLVKTGGGSYLPSLPAVGVYYADPNPDRIQAWRNVTGSVVGGDSIDIWQDCTNAGTGRAIVTINYVPGMNLPDSV